MKKDKNQTSFTAIGSSSLLVVFLVLCLTTFAILSLSSAKSDYTFTKRLADHKSDYYAATSQAEYIAAGIDNVLENTYKSKTMAYEEYLDALTLVLLTYEAAPLSYTRENDVPVISYQVPVDDRQTLFVRLRVTNPLESPNYYEVAAWEVSPSKEWENDDTLNLMPVQ